MKSEKYEHSIIGFDIQFLGNHEFTNGIAHATDPMTRNDGSRVTIEVIPGVYSCFATACTDISGNPTLDRLYKGRPAEVAIVNDNYSYIDDVDCEDGEHFTTKKVGEIWVDSASAGIFNNLPDLSSEEAFDFHTWNDVYVIHKDNPDRNVNDILEDRTVGSNDESLLEIKTSKSKYYATMCNYGILSLSGLGDGRYSVYAHYDNTIDDNRAFAISIRFI